MFISDHKSKINLYKQIEGVGDGGGDDGGGDGGGSESSESGGNEGNCGGGGGIISFRSFPELFRKQVYTENVDRNYNDFLKINKYK